MSHKSYWLCITPATGRVARYLYHRGWWQPQLQNVAMIEPLAAVEEMGAPDGRRMLEQFRVNGPGGVK